MSYPPITTLFLDIGGVLLTNGWDRLARQQAAEYFHLDLADFEERHHLTYDTYEEGKLSLDGYLQRVIFFKDQPFSIAQFKEFLFSRSQPFPEMIDLIRNLKALHSLSILAVSNEGREVNAYRIATFGLHQVIDTFVSSCFIHIRKPDPEIFRIALDISQSVPGQVVYIDDRPLFIEVAASLGIHGILHSSISESRRSLAEMGLFVQSAEKLPG